VLKEVSHTTHKTMAEIIRNLPKSIVKPALEFPGVLDLVDVDGLEDQEIKAAINHWVQ